ncbi:MAG: hypothetical protein L3J43_06180 [Sulfurovum sp.]|nr:hypothetical protein [Sulfurovum sp.]
MYRYIFVLVLFMLTSSGSVKENVKVVHFLEEKYFESLDMTFNKKGQIRFFKEKIEIRYTDDKTVLTYNGDVLLRQKGSNLSKIDLQKKPAIKMFFVLFEAIYFEKKKILQSYFSLKRRNGITTLTPHKNIAAYIENVQYQKKGTHLGFLKINMRNNDRILIEETY